MAISSSQQHDDRSAGELVEQLSDQVSTLIRDEMRMAKTELQGKAKHAGAGFGLFSGAGVLTFLGLATLVACAVLALATAISAWAAALIVGAVLLIGAAIAAVFGKKEIEQAADPVPERAVKNVKRDVDELKESRQR